MKRLITVAGLALVFVAMFGLYELSYRVDRQEAQLRTLTGRIATEKQAIAVLRAEWAYLTRPQAIQDRAIENLAMQPTLPGQMVAFHDVPEREKRLITAPDGGPDGGPGDGDGAMPGVVLVAGEILPLPRPRPAGHLRLAVAEAVTAATEQAGAGAMTGSGTVAGRADPPPVRSATARAAPERPAPQRPSAPPARRQADAATAQLEVAMRRPTPPGGGRLLPAAMEARLLKVAAQQVSGEDTARILIGGQ
ncbi:MAG: hypothetical protein RIB84_03355 [Sneathiellaceae bacterium]